MCAACRRRHGDRVLGCCGWTEWWSEKKDSLRYAFQMVVKISHLHLEGQCQRSWTWAYVSCALFAWIAENRRVVSHNSCAVDATASGCVRWAPWSVANRLHGQRTGEFSWRPMLRPSPEDRRTPKQPYPEMRTWMAMWSGVISASIRNRVELRHLPTCDQPNWLCSACIPFTTSIPAPTQPAIKMTNYTHAPTRQPSTYNSSFSEIIHRRPC